VNNNKLDITKSMYTTFQTTNNNYKPLTTIKYIFKTTKIP